MNFLVVVGLSVLFAASSAFPTSAFAEPGSEPGTDAGVAAHVVRVEPNDPASEDSILGCAEWAASEGLDGLSSVLAVELCRLGQSNVFPKDCFRRLAVSHEYKEDTLWKNVFAATRFRSIRAKSIADFRQHPEEAKGDVSRWLTIWSVVLDGEHVLLVQIGGSVSDDGLVADELVIGCMGSSGFAEEVCQDLASAAAARGVGCDEVDQRVLPGVSEVIVARRDGRYIAARFSRVEGGDPELHVTQLTKDGTAGYRVASDLTVKLPPSHPATSAWTQLKIKRPVGDEANAGDEGAADEYALIFKTGAFCMAGWPEYHYVSAEDVAKHGIEAVVDWLERVRAEELQEPE
ncbi:MAG: hypothetical protein KF858_01455 [Candidatus Sumerlaeia bacterium]|nr:hypothetical protein [Candidatus Sumerlaeia bacterium]